MIKRKKNITRNPLFSGFYCRSGREYAMGGEGYGTLEEEFADENINYIPGI